AGGQPALRHAALTTNMLVVRPASHGRMAMGKLDKFLTIDELMAEARRKVPKQFFDYADSGAWTESTYRANAEDFKKILLRQRVAVNMEGRSLASSFGGEQASMPVALAPTGFTGMQ